ncbi:MAG: hypothetical protein PVG66_07260 [Chromatiales bacterium]|jgi:hypothetical protein
MNIKATTAVILTGLTLSLAAPLTFASNDFNEARQERQTFMKQQHEAYKEGNYEDRMYQRENRKQERNQYREQKQQRYQYKTGNMIQQGRGSGKGK